MIWDRYDDRWTRLSFEEMLNFTRWMNELIGYHPTIVGGWAVYLHCPEGFGSRDIDVVIPTRSMKNAVIERYLGSNGYVLVNKAFGVKEWIKELEPGDPDSITYLDVCTLEDRNVVHGTNLEIPWKIAHEYQQVHEIQGKLLYIPQVEALLLLKSKAAWDRAHDIRMGGSTPFLADKVRKDRFDILSLLHNCEVDDKKLVDLSSKYGFNDHLMEVLVKALSDGEVQDELSKRYGALGILEKRASSILYVLGSDRS